MKFTVTLLAFAVVVLFTAGSNAQRKNRDQGTGEGRKPERGNAHQITTSQFYHPVQSSRRSRQEAPYD